jgi:hypothetical protein
MYACCGCYVLITLRDFLIYKILIWRISDRNQNPTKTSVRWNACNMRLVSVCSQIYIFAGGGEKQFRSSGPSSECYLNSYATLERQYSVNANHLTIKVLVALIRSHVLRTHVLMINCRVGFPLSDVLFFRTQCQ